MSGGGRSGGHLLTVSGPSGAGKTHLVNYLTGADDDVALSVSHTTRPIRDGERDGVNYHFVSRERFEAMLADGAFLEHAVVFGNLYGTAREQVEALLASGRDVILEIDWQGARQARQLVAGCRSVFILPPSRESLERRLRGRGQDDPAVIAQRMAQAVNEMSHYDEADFLIVNDDLRRAEADMLRILQAVRGAGAAEALDLASQQRRHRNLLRELLAD
jgi:guanylate kinase